MIQPDSPKFLAQDVEARHSDPIPPTKANPQVCSPLTKAHICVLLAIAARGDQGILEATLIQYALLNISEAIDVKETIDQFEKAKWISTEWEVLIGDSNALKTRRCKISEVGRHAAVLAEVILPPPQPVADRRAKLEDAENQPSAQCLGECDESLSSD